MRCLPRVCVLSALCLLLVAAPAFADTVTFTASGTGTDGALSASAVFVTSAGQVFLTLTNTLGADTIRSVGQAVSDISFTLSNAPGTNGPNSSIGQQGNVSSTGVVTYVAGSPDRFLGIGGGSFTIVGNTITLEAIGSGQPTQLIIPFKADGTTYGNTNPGFDAHNPYTIGPASFTLLLTGVTENTTVSDVTFSFGTGPDTFLPGTPGTQTPEPASVLMLGSGLLGLAGILRRKLRR
jgi:PEP-CTERM motif